MAAGRGQGQEPGGGKGQAPSSRPFPTDELDEGWCRQHGLSSSGLRLAGVVRAELLEVMQRIELPVSPPTFGTDDNVLNLKRALISGYFLKVGGPPEQGALWGRRLPGSLRGRGGPACVPGEGPCPGCPGPLQGVGSPTWGRKGVGALPRLP